MLSVISSSDSPKLWNVVVTMYVLDPDNDIYVSESRVNIPYHQPSPKSINAFLARASMKQQQYKVLRGVRDSTYVFPVYFSFLACPCKSP